jgi:ribosomal protein S18 acetylase RimI-like enzyme
MLIKEIIIRPANILDVNKLAKLSQECLPISYNTLDFLYFISSSKLFEDHLVLLAECNNKIISYILIKFKKNNIHILSLCVDKDYRRFKIASNLIKEIKKIKKLNTNISLHVYVENESAINCYLKLGFVVKYKIKNYYTSIQEYDKNTSQDGLYMSFS